MNLLAPSPKRHGGDDVIDIGAADARRDRHAGEIDVHRLEGHEEVEALEQRRVGTARGGEHLVLRQDIGHLKAARQLLDAMRAPKGQIVPQFTTRPTR